MSYLSDLRPSVLGQDRTQTKNKKLSSRWQTRATRLEGSNGHQTWYHSMLGRAYIYSFLLVWNSNLSLIVFYSTSKKCLDLEIWVRGHLRSLKMVPFVRLCVVSCYSSIVTLSVSFFRYSTKNAVTLKTGIEIRKGHWKRHHSIESLWLPIDVL